MKAVLISAQFLVALPPDMHTDEAEAFGIDWLSNLNTNAIDYRHPQVAGVFLRPVPVQVKDIERSDVLSDENLIQL